MDLGKKIVIYPFEIFKCKKIYKGKIYKDWKVKYKDEKKDKVISILIHLFSNLHYTLIDIDFIILIKFN